MLDGYSKWLQKIWTDSREGHPDQHETLEEASLDAFQGDTVEVGPVLPALWEQAQEQECSMKRYSQVALSQDSN